MERNERKIAAEPADWARPGGGIRKTAIFLSILDEKTAGEILARLEPEAARAVEAELKRVGELSPAEIEAVAAEFLALNGGKSENSDALAEERCLNLSNLTENRTASVDISRSRPDFDAVRGESEDRLGDWREIIGIGGNGGFDKLSSFDDDFQALDAFEPETLAEILRDESAPVAAVVLSRLSTARRVETSALLSAKLADDATRLTAALERGRTETAQFLEDAVFNRAF